MSTVSLFSSSMHHQGIRLFVSCTRYSPHIGFCSQPGQTRTLLDSQIVATAPVITALLSNSQNLEYSSLKGGSPKLPHSSWAVFVHVPISMKTHCQGEQSYHHWFRLIKIPLFPPGAGVTLSLLLNRLPSDTWTKLRFCSKEGTREDCG